MPEALILEFEGIGRTEYDQVNEKLGIDMATGAGEWPAGLLTHAAGTSDEGTFVVQEVWFSREAQASFMAARLGEALASVGVPAPIRVTWTKLVAYQSPCE